jgi:hypothetical protein
LAEKTYRRTVGDTYILKATFTIAGTPVDLTGYSLAFNYKNSKVGGTIAGVVTGTGTGEFTPSALDFLDPGEYKFNIKATKGTEITTYLKGRLILEEDL